jgi:hypothetical protein
MLAGRETMDLHIRGSIGACLGLGILYRKKYVKKIEIKRSLNSRASLTGPDSTDGPSDEI